MSERTIFKALNAVQSRLAQKGIGKNQRNDFDKYNYRGIDAVLNALAPVLSECGVLILPHVTAKEIAQVTTQKGGTMAHATLLVAYSLYDAEGDSITLPVYGEAIDRGDKAINKAMTAAYKNLVFQAFCIPLVGDYADSESHELTAPEKPQPTITQDQEMELAGALVAAGISLDDFCKKGGIKSLDLLLASRYEGALKWAQGQKAKDLTDNYPVCSTDGVDRCG